MKLFAVDPGPSQSGWLLCETDPFRVLASGVSLNFEMLDGFREYRVEFDVLVIEKVESFGMAVGEEVFDTVFVSGSFAEAVQRDRHVPVVRIGRRAVKLNLCGSARAKDANIRQAVIDRFGGASAIGKKDSPGPLYGVKSHVWPALALALTWIDTHPRPADAPSVEEMLDADRAAGRVS